MILDEIQRQFEEGKNGEFTYPRYTDFCISNIPSAVLYLLGLQKTTPLAKILDVAGIKPTIGRKVVVFLIDGLGYKQWLKYVNYYELPKLLSEKGLVFPLTSVFPSSTAAALTTIHSGLTPQEHGLPGWLVYFSEIDKIIETIPFTPLGENGYDKLLNTGTDPRILFDGRTIYQMLAARQVPSFTFVRNAYIKSAYSNIVLSGSERISFINSSDLLVNLRKKIEEEPSCGYFYVYWDALDSIAHRYGPHTDQYLAELNSFFYLLQKELIEKISRNLANDISILLTGDHGQLNVNPKQTIYLNQYHEIGESLNVGPSGNRILPWGSARNVFISVKQDCVNNVHAFLTKALNGHATVIRTEIALNQGLFGLGKFHHKFKSRIGNILVLPNGNSTISFEHFHGEKIEYLGMHGGLSDEEMLVPLAVANVDQLI